MEKIKKFLKNGLERIKKAIKVKEIFSVILVLSFLFSGALNVGAASVQPETLNYNPITCQTIGYELGYKIDPTHDGTYNVSGMGSVTITNTEKGYFNWTSTFGINAVIVKGGPSANVYYYGSSLAKGDTDLHTPDNPGGQIPDISFITFCYKNGEISPTEYTVVFDGNGGTPETQEKTVEEGETIDPLPTAEREGYNFIEWNTKSDGEGDKFTTDTAVNENITVYAIWEKMEEPEPTYYTVTFMDGDKTYATTSVLEGKYVGDDMPENPTKKGYIFKGWKDSEGNPFTAETIVDADITVYAKWYKVPACYYTVTFKGNGGTPAIQEEAVLKGTAVDPLPAVTKEGYNFIEWNTKGDGTGSEFTTSTKVIKNITVYAIWEKIEEPEIPNITIKAYKVICEDESYLPNWARTSSHPSMITKDLITGYVNDSCGKCWFAPSWQFEWGEANAPKMPGDHYGLAGEGWNVFGPTDSEGKAIAEIEYIEGRSHFWVREVLKEGYIPFAHPEKGWDTGKKMVSAEMLCHIDGYKYDNYDRVDNPQAGGVYYCVAFNALKKEIEPTYYTVTFMDGDKTYATTSVLEGESVGADMPENPTKKGYTFKGWKDGEGNPFTAETIVDADITVYAKWYKVPACYYTVTFKGNGGIPTSTEEIVEKGKTIDSLPTVTKEGYNFIEWNTKSDGTGSEFTTSTKVIKNITVYAIWEKIEEPEPTYYTVTFDGNSGTPTSTEKTVEEGETVDSLPTVTKEGYNFIEWNTKSDGTGDKFTTATAVNEDITVYAIWEKKTVPPTYTGGGRIIHTPITVSEPEPEEKPEEEILGDDTELECDIYLYEYIKFGANNNPNEVRKLQIFLNDHMGAGLPVTGFYGQLTMQAVDAFQVRYKEQVLKPWVDAGVHCDVNQPTGYVYKTTKRWINLIMCPTLNIPMPDLSAYPKANCFAYTPDITDIPVPAPGEVLGEETEWIEDEIEEDIDEETVDPNDIEIDHEEDIDEEENDRDAEERSWFLTAILLAILVAVGIVGSSLYKTLKKS